ncbi:MAG: aminodeoxychorismate lyase [Pseudomonadota bacterium]
MSILKSWVNGEPGDSISIFDRGFLYGHTLFETITVVAGKPRLIDFHFARLAKSCSALLIECDVSLIRAELDEFCSDLDQAIVRLTLSVGEGGRGYKTPDKVSVTRVMAAYERVARPVADYEQGVTVGTINSPLSAQSFLAGHKHGNRLEQIMLREQWQTHWQEALVYDAQGGLIEATQANVLLRTANHVITPDLAHSGVVGVMRDFALSQLSSAGYSSQEQQVEQSDLLGAEEVILTNSVVGALPVSELRNASDEVIKTFDAQDFTLSRVINERLLSHGMV